MGNVPEVPVAELPPGPWTDDFKNYPENIYTFVMYDDNDLNSETKKEYKCCVKRMPCYYWNGYVTVPPTHQFYGAAYLIKYRQRIIDVHGGLTCKTENGTFGFDTHHILSGDISPTYVYYQEQSKILPIQDPTIRLTLALGTVFSNEPKYWTFEEVKKETEKLARQLMKLHN